jgi:hypothetical protein
MNTRRHLLLIYFGCALLFVLAGVLARPLFNKAPATKPSPLFNKAPATKPSPLVVDAWKLALDAPLPGEQSAATPPQEEDFVRQMRRVAQERDLHWHAFCSMEDEYVAAAWPAGDDVTRAKQYIEDGGTPSWLVTASTQKQVVQALLVALQHAPNLQPEHKPNVAPHQPHKKQCPPAIGRNQFGDY